MKLHTSMVISKTTMEASSNYSSYIEGFKLKQPLDNWTLREKLALACAVLRSGDQNWVSVSRQVKPFGEADRSSEWFSQRNCAAQYTDLLETIETPNRRKRGERESTESPQLLIARKLTLERVEELREIIKKQQDECYTMQEEAEKIRAGHHDDRIVEMWSQIQEQERIKQEEAALKAEKGAGDVSSAPSTPGHLTPFSEVKVKVEPEDDTENVPISVTEDDVGMEIETETVLDDNVLIKEEVVSTPTSFQSEPIATEEVVTEPDTHTQEIKEEAIKTPEIVQQIVEIKQELTEEAVEVEAVEETEVHILPEAHLEEVIQEETCSTPFETEENVEEEQELMSEEPKEAEETKTAESQSNVKANTSHESVQLDDNQPLSPASSVASHDTDVALNSSGRRGRRSRGGGRGRKSRGLIKEQISETKPIASDLDSSDEDEKESNASTKPSMSFVGSLPSSPAGSTQGDLDVDEKTHKNWKKSIMLVWRAAANHKYAKVFQQPVTEAVAPGYKSIVLRPMDLQTIKKNIEGGCIRSTVEFQRDIMLMFTNAIMYNNCDHNVYRMAQEMYDDVMHNIEQYISTQAMLHAGETPTSSGSTASKVLRQSRRSETQTQSGSERSDVDKDDDPKKRRTSTEIIQDGGKAKKRKP